MRAPSSFSIVSSTTEKDRGSTSSWRCSSSRMYGSGRRRFGVLGRQAFDPLSLGEILQAIAREQADRRGKAREIAGRQEHDRGESIFRSDCAAVGGAAIFISLSGKDDRIQNTQFRMQRFGCILNSVF
jgi:hypothetical protein